VGSSFLPGELIAAFLWAQMEEAERIIDNRKQAWLKYHLELKGLEAQGCFKRPHVPEACEHNGHMYYLVFDDQSQRDKVLDGLNAKGIMSVFHYVPLHSSPAGEKYGRAHGSMEQTHRASACILRLPLWVNMGQAQDRVIDTLKGLLVKV
jgi:dTDP-4-amino-4,6-dideoxygalactose transaminase